MSKSGPVPKLIGGDIELANFILGREGASPKTDFEASRRLLAQVDGLPNSSEMDEFRLATIPAATTVNQHPYLGHQSQDFGRRYLPFNGGCIYIDLNHLELATPEVTSARQHQAVWSGMLRMARQVQQKANRVLPEHERIVVLANNSDRQGKSYGGHQSFLINRETWDDMMRRQMFPGLFFLMAYQASSIVFTGQGKVGSENGQPPVRYQISQRSDFIETLLSIETTEHRPLVNTRDEPLCGLMTSSPGGNRPADRYARLHVIFYDTNLAPVAIYLKVGVMQLILTMIEDGFTDRQLLLEKPLEALHAWSHDPDLQVKSSTITGQCLSAVELQLKFLEQAKLYERTRGFDKYVPDAHHIIALWEDTLLKLASRNFTDLRGRIDWITKRALLDQALQRHPGWNWDSPEVTHIDQIYSSIDPADGLFLSLEESGLIEPIASESEIAAFIDNPPEDTRAWTRAMLLRALNSDQVAHIDWDMIVLKAANGETRRIRIELPDPLGATRAQTLPVFSEPGDASELLARLRQHGVEFSTTTYAYSGVTAYPLSGMPLPNYHQPN